MLGTCIANAGRCPNAIWKDWPIGCSLGVVQFDYGAPARVVGDPEECPYFETVKQEADHD